MPDVVLTPPEIARRWRSKPDSVRHKLESGELPGFRIGNRWRVTLAAVEAFERGESPSQRIDTPKPRRRRRQLQVTEFFK